MLVKDPKTKRLPVIFPINMHNFAEKTASEGAPSEIHVLPVGKWNHPAYGPLTITREDIGEFKRNFDNGLRKGIPITEGHDNGMGGGELPAIAWFTDLIDRGANGLYAVVDWTEKGKTLLAEKAFKFFSPEFYSEYEDPETRTIHENVLVGGALTNKPYFRELQAVVMREPNINNQFNENNNMNLQEILAKKVEELSDEEKTFLVEHKDELNDEQKTTFESVLKDETEETEEEKKAREEKEEGDANEAKGLNRDGSAKELTDEEKQANIDAGKNEDGTEKTPDGGDGGEGGEGGQQNASDPKTDAKGNVIMSMAEYKGLSSKANAGYDASEKLRMSEIQTESNKLVFSEQNSKGRFLPAQSEKVFSFMKGLKDEAQRKAFTELVNTIPETKLFNEVGHSGNTEGTAFAEIEAKTKKVMSENKGMAYADALKKVFEENPTLANRYETEK